MAENYKTNFEYHVPRDLGEALDLLSKYGASAKLIAGGTDLIPKVKAGVMKFDHLVSMKELRGLDRISFDPEKGLTIGSMTRLREAEASGAVKKYYPALWTGAHSMANTQIRNRGTIVGNICNAVPSADMAPSLLVYRAQVMIAGKNGARAVPIEEFFTGVCRTVVAPDEIVTGLFIPAPAAGAFSVYYKYTIRKGLDLAMIGAAACVAFEKDGTVKDAAIALGAVAAVPKRAPKTEALIKGKRLTEELIAEAAKTASREDCSPISDIRATADYRREMVRVHVRDALRKAAETI